MEAITSNNTWKLCVLLEEKKVIGLKWIYKTKHDTKGLVLKLKARIFVKDILSKKELL